MKDKSKVLKTYGNMFDKLQFICLIGGRPHLGATRPPIRPINCSLYMLYLEYAPRILHRDAMKGAVLANKGTTVNAYDVAIGEGLA